MSLLVFQTKDPKVQKKYSLAMTFAQGDTASAVT